MSRKERSIAGISLGDVGGPKRAIAEEIRRQGVQVHFETISEIRRGEKSGVVVDERDLSREALRFPVARKDAYYHTLAAIGTLLVKTPGVRHPSQGLTEAIAETLRIDTNTVRQLLQAMRLDFVLAFPDRDSNKAPNEETPPTPPPDYFLSEMNTMLSEARQSIGHQNLALTWNGRSAEDFYRSMYEELHTSSIGTGVPSELRVFERFYRERMAVGSPHSPLDLRVLNHFRLGKEQKMLTRELRAETGINVQLDSLTHHRQLILHGVPFLNSGFLSSTRSS